MNDTNSASMTPGGSPSYKPRIDLHVREVKNGFVVNIYGIGDTGGEHVAKDRAETLALITSFLQE